MTFRKVSRFTSADEALNRSLRELEDNVSRGFEDAAKSSVPRARRVAVTLSGSVVRPGERVVVDNGATAELLLATPSTDSDGLEVVLVKKAAGGTVTLRAVNSTINAAGSLAITAVGVTRALVDKGAYWV